MGKGHQYQHLINTEISQVKIQTHKLTSRSQYYHATSPTFISCYMHLQFQFKNLTLASYSLMFYGTTLKCPHFYLYILVWSLAVSNAGNTLPDFQNHRIADLLTQHDCLEYHLVAVVFTTDQIVF